MSARTKPQTAANWMGFSFMKALALAGSILSALSSVRLKIPPMMPPEMPQIRT